MPPPPPVLLLLLLQPERIGDRRRQLAVGDYRGDVTKRNETKRKAKAKLATGKEAAVPAAKVPTKVGKVNGAWAMSKHGNCKDSDRN